MIALVTHGVFTGYLAGGPDLAAKAGTMAFPVIVISRLFNALAFSGSRERSLIESGLFRNPWLWAAVGFGLVTQFLITEFGMLRSVFGTVPLGVVDWGLCCWFLLRRLSWWRESKGGKEMAGGWGVRSGHWPSGLRRVKAAKGGDEGYQCGNWFFAM